MAYGTLAVDYILYTSNSTDTTATISSVFNGQFPGVTTTGTVSGGHIVGTSGTISNLVTASGITVTGSGIPQNGLYSPATNQVGLSSSGVSRLTVSESGQLNVSAAYQATARTVSALNIDCTSGNYYIKTITGSSTFTVSNAPASGSAYSFTLEVVHTSGTITWFSGLEWPGGTAPTLTTGKTHLFMFLTDDGGSRWRGSSLINYTT
jgi:hypothetical protein